MIQEFFDELNEQLEEFDKRIDELANECVDELPCENRSNDSATLIEVLHRFAKREWLSHKPEHRKACAVINIDTLCDIFGWTDMEV